MTNSPKPNILLAGFSKEILDNITHFFKDILSEYELESVKEISEIKSQNSLNAGGLLFIMVPESTPNQKLFCKKVAAWNEINPTLLFANSRNSTLDKYLTSVGLSKCLNLKNLTPQLLEMAIEFAIQASKTRQQLKHTTLRYRHLFEQSPLPMWIYKEDDFTILNVNDAALRLYGYSREEFLNLTIKDLRPEEDVPQLFKAIKDRKKGKIPVKQKFRHLKKNGEIFYVDLKSDDIEIEGIKARLILSTDISERVVAQEALAISEQRYKALAKYGADLIAILNREGKLTHVAPATEGQLGYKTDFLLNKNLFRFLHKEDLAAYKARFELVLNSDRKIQMPLARVRNTKGEWRWISSSIINLFDNPSIEGLVINGRDVTVDFENQLKTQESIERYENVAKVTHDVIYTYNLQHQLSTIAGTGHKTIFGHKVPSATFDKDFWKSKIHPDDLTMVENKLTEILANRKKQQGSLEFRFRKADGTYADILDNFFIVYNEGKPYELQGVMRDITLQKFQGTLTKFEKDIYELNTRPDLDTSKILEEVIIKIEKLIPDSHCSILELVDNTVIRHLSAPTLPADYCEELNGLAIGPKAGSCGTAMYLGQNVIVSNISNDPLWSDYKSFAQKHRLKSCWSIPIKLKTGVVIGSFATYYYTEKAPAKKELLLIERAAHVLGSLMEGWEAREATERSNERYDLAAKATNDIIWDFDIKQGVTTYSQGISQILGYPESERVQHSGWWRDHLHPEDRHLSDLAFERIEQGADHINLIYRFRCADDTYKHIEDRAYVVRDNDGQPTRLIGAMKDVTERVNYILEIESQNKILKEITWQQSHEVRAPLSRIMGLVELLETVSFDTPEEKTKIFGHIKDSAEEMDNVIRSIVSKIDAEKIKVH